MILLALTSGGVGAARLRRRGRDARRLAGLRVEAEDLHAIGKIIAALDSPHDPTRAFAMTTLTQMLPRLHPGESPRLTPEAHAALCRHLMNSSPPMRDYGAYIHRYTEFALATLAALGRVGEGDDLRAVRKLARDSTDARIRKAASDCLDALNASLETRKIGETLLRAATGAAPTSGADILLRAASPSAGTTASDELLRASREEDPLAFLAPDPRLELEPEIEPETAPPSTPRETPDDAKPGV